jgi:hypothetical protein
MKDVLKQNLMAGFRAIPLHFFPERRSIREPMAVYSTSTRRSGESRCACQLAFSHSHADNDVATVWSMIC